MSVFISYRRSDDPSVVHALLAHLERVFPPQDLFLDVETIKAGDDFAKLIDDRLQVCRVLLAVIGPTWLEVTDAEGRRRLEQADDFVRHEISRAMALKKSVVPVLVRGAVPPPAEKLPDDIKNLASLQAMRLDHERFRSDVNHLINEIKQLIARASSQPDGAAGPGWLRTVAIFLLCGLLACLLSEALYYSQQGMPDLTVSPGLLQSLTLNVLAALPIAAAWPIAARWSGFRLIRTLIVPVIVFIVAWTVSAIYWENYSPLRAEGNVLDRDVLCNLVVMGGWALYFPRLQRIEYFIGAVLCAVFGSVASTNLGGLSSEYVTVVVLQSIAINVPFFALIGYAISQGERWSPDTASRDT